MGLSCFYAGKEASAVAEAMGYDASKKTGKFSPEVVSIYMGTYETETGNKLPLIDINDQDSIDKVASIISDYADELAEINRKNFAKAAKKGNIGNNYNSLLRTFTRVEISDAASSIITLVSEVVDAIEKVDGANYGLSREEILKGTVVEDANGKRKVGGLPTILEEVRSLFISKILSVNSLIVKLENKKKDAQELLKEFKGEALFLSMADQQKDLISFYNKELEKLNAIRPLAMKIISPENWGSVCAYASKFLTRKEGVKMDGSGRFTGIATSLNFDDIDSPAARFDYEAAARESWQMIREMQSSFSNLPQELRRFLSSLPRFEFFEGVGAMVVRNTLGFAETLDGVRTLQFLKEALFGVASEEEMMEKLDEVVKDYPTFRPVNEALKSNSWATNVIKTQLFNAIRCGHQAYSMSIDEGAKTDKTGKRSHSYKTKIINEESSEVSEEGFLSKLPPANIDKKKYIDLLTQLHDLMEIKNTIKVGGLEMDDGTSTDWFKLSVDKKADFLVTFLNALHVDYYSRDNIISVLKTTQRSEITSALNSIALRDLGKKLLDTLNKKGDYSEVDFFKDVAVGRQGLSKGLSLVNVAVRLQKLFTSKQNRMTLQTRGKYFDRKGNAIYMYTDVTPSYLSDKINIIHNFANKNDADGLKKYLEDNFLNSSMFMDDGNILSPFIKELYDACTPKKNSSGKETQVDLADTFAGVFDFERMLGSDKVPFEDFTMKMHNLDLFVKYFSFQQQNKGTEYGLYPIFILGDSGVQKYIKAKRYKVTKGSDGKFTSEEMLDLFYNIYRSERNRMILQVESAQKLFNEGLATVEKKDGKLKFKGIDNYHNDIIVTEKKDGTYEFSVETKYSNLKFLNPTFKLSPEAEQGKYAKMLESFGDNKDIPDNIKSVIKEYLNDAAQEFKNRMGTIGLLEKTNEGKEGNEAYLYMESFLPAAEQGETQESRLDRAIADFYWNYKLATIAQIQMMTIDPSFYANTKDLQKRYKEIHAPGKLLSIFALDLDNNRLFENPEDAVEKVKYFKDIRLSGEDFDPVFMAAIANNFEGGENSAVYRLYSTREGSKGNTLTDGQGYRSLTSYRKISIMAGQWNHKMEAAYNKILAIRESGKELTEEDIKELARLAVVFQPIKPYLFTHERLDLGNGEYMYIPVQHKYAEIVLIPELMRDGTLKDIATYMEDKGIDLVCSTSCVKVGAFGECALNEADTLEKVQVALDGAATHSLNYSDYRIQTNVPNHIDEAGRLIGTQIRKLIMAGLIEYDEFGREVTTYYNDYLKDYREEGKDYTEVKLANDRDKVRLTGRNTLKLYNALTVANIVDSYEDFKKVMSNPKKMAEVLAQQVLDNNRVPIDLLNALTLVNGDFGMPLWEGALEHDTAAMLISIFKNSVNKQRIKGGSAVQASAFGIARANGDVTGDLHMIAVDKDGNYVIDTDPDFKKKAVNIVEVQIEMPFNFTYTDAYGNEIALDYNKYCNIDGTLKINKKTGKSLLEEEFPKITEFIAYRIPTENDYSTMNVKVKRFSKPEMGGIMMVPLVCTTMAGFDFDIDKLYFMRREYRELKPHWQRVQLEKEDRNKIYDKIAELHPEFVTTVDPIVAKNFSDHQLKDIFTQIFIDNYRLKSVLKTDRDIAHGGVYNRKKDGYDPLNSYMVESNSSLLDMAKKAGYETVKDWKNHLVLDAADRLQMIPEIIREVKGGYEKIDNEKVENAGKTIKELFNEAAEHLGIELKENKNPRFHKYDTNKTPWDNSRTARNNLLIDLMQDRLRDRRTFKNRYTPGGFPEASKAARKQRELLFGNLDGTQEGLNALLKNSKTVDFEELERRASSRELEALDPEPDYDYSDPYTLLVYNEQNQVAGKLIGVFANQNTNYAFSSIMKTLQLKNNLAIEFAGHSKEEGYGLDLLHGPKGVNVAINVAEYLAASVDAVKDPVLNFLFLNACTADVGALLARTGYNAFEIGTLFNQPIIREAVMKALNDNIQLSLAIKETRDKHLKEKEEIDAGRTDDDFSLNQLVLNIIDYRKDGNKKFSEDAFRKNQLKVLNLFESAMLSAKELSDFITTTKFTAANSVGSTMGEFYNQQMRVQDYLNKYQEDLNNTSTQDSKNMALRFEYALTDDIETPVSIDTDFNALSDHYAERLEGYMDSLLENPFAFEQAMFDANRAVVKTMSKYFPYETSIYKASRELLRKCVLWGIPSGELIDRLHRHLPVYLLSKQSNSIFDGDRKIRYETEGKEDEVTARDFYTTGKFVEIFREIQNMARNPDSNFTSLEIEFLESLDIDMKNTGTSFHPIYTPYLKIKNIGGLEQEQKDRITDGWEALHKSKEHKELAESLYLYNFFNLGFDYGYSVFMSLAPTSLKQSLTVIEKEDTKRDRSYVEFLKEIQGNNYNANMAADFVRLFLRNNVNDAQIVYEVKNRELKDLINKISLSGGVKIKINPFKVDLNSKEFKNFKDYFTLPDRSVDEKDPDVTIFKPLIKVEVGDKIQFFAANGEGALENESHTGAIEYVPIEGLGKKGVQVYYYDRTRSVTQNSVQNFSEIQSESEGVIMNNGIEQVETPPRPYTRDEIINRVFEDLKNNNALPEGTIKTMVESLSDAQLADYARTKLSDIDVSRIQTIDDNGKETFMC